jgi:hypothetical protein
MFRSLTGYSIIQRQRSIQQDSPYLARSFIFARRAASTVAGMPGFTFSTAHTAATFGSSIPSFFADKPPHY